MSAWTRLALAACCLAAIAVAAALLWPRQDRPYQVATTVDSDRSVDIQDYSFRIDVNDSTDVIHGTATVRLVSARDGLDEVLLDLVGPPSGETGMRVQAARVSEPGDNETSDPAMHAALYTHDDDVLQVRLPGPLDHGEVAVLEIEYNGVPGDGLVIGQNRHGARTFFGDNWPNRARHWLPTVDHVADKATVTFDVVAPDHYRVIASGRRVLEEDAGKGRRRTLSKTDVSLPTKVMVVGIAPFAVEDLGVVSGVPLSSWVYPEDRDAGFSDYRLSADVVTYFVNEIGEFPYTKLANVQSTTRYGGMENAGNIFYSESSVTGTGSAEGLIAHEIAHQWFGDSVTEADWHHIWLSEGFATYFTQLYFEHTYGRGRMNSGLIAQRGSITRYATRNPDSPVVDTTIVDLNELLSTNSYQKGGWVLHMLRRQVGTQAFWQGIRLYYERHRDQNALTSDLRAAMEETSGQSLDWFFDQWLRRPGQPELRVNWTPTEGMDGQHIVTVSVDQRQRWPAFTFPLDIGFTLNDRDTTYVVTLDVSDESQQFEVELPAQATGAALDPDVWLLMSGEIGRR